MHLSILSKGSSVELKQCVDNDCCEHNVHCPLCTVQLFKPASFERTAAHLQEQHIANGMEIKEYLSLMCQLECIPGKFPHYHCPGCKYASKRSAAFTKHVSGCHTGKDEDSGLWSTLVREKGAGIAEVLQQLGLEADVPPTQPAKVFKHSSIVLRLTDLAVPRCTSCCTLYHCPICPKECLKACRPLRMAQHLLSQHWNRRLSLNRIHILKCTMAICLRNPSRFAQSHYHCPMCKKTMLSLQRIKMHLDCHKKGTVKRDRVNSCNSNTGEIVHSFDPELEQELAADISGTAPAGRYVLTPGQMEQILMAGDVEGYVELPDGMDDEDGQIEFMEVMDQNAPITVGEPTGSVTFVEITPADMMQHEEQQQNSEILQQEAEQQQNSEILQQEAEQQQNSEILQQQNSEILQQQNSEILQQQNTEILQEAEQQQNIEILQQQNTEILQEAEQQQNIEILQQQNSEILQDAEPQEAEQQILQETEHETEVIIKYEEVPMSEQQEEEEDVEPLQEGEVGVVDQGAEDQMEVMNNKTDTAAVMCSKAVQAGEDSIVFTPCSDDDNANSKGDANFDVFTKVGAILNSRLLDMIPGAKSTVMNSLEENFGLTCKMSESSDSVSIEGKWWQVTCAHMILEEMKDTKPSTTQQLQAIFNQTQQETTATHSPEKPCKEEGPIMEDQPRKDGSKGRRKKGRPRKNDKPETKEDFKPPKYLPAPIERPRTRSRGKRAHREEAAVLDEEELTIENQDVDHESQQDVDSENQQDADPEYQQGADPENQQDADPEYQQGADPENQQDADPENQQDEDQEYQQDVDNEYPQNAIKQDPAEEVEEYNRVLHDDNVGPERLSEIRQAIVVVPLRSQRNTDSGGEEKDKKRKYQNDEEQTLEAEVSLKKAKLSDSWDIKIEFSNAVTKSEPAACETVVHEYSDNVHSVIVNQADTSEAIIQEIQVSTDSIEGQVLVQNDGVITEEAPAYIPISGRVTEDLDEPDAYDESLRTCPGCNVLFPSRPEFFYHILEDIKCSKVKLKEFVPKLRPVLTNMKRVQTNQCLYCNSQFETLLDCKVHVGVRICRPKQRWNPNNISRDGASGRFQCPLCSYTSKTAAGVVSHVTVRHTEKTIPCDLCEHKFATEKLLEKHKEQIHLNTETCVCHICGKRMLTRNMKKHVKDVHVTGESCHSMRRLEEPLVCGERNCSYSTHYSDVLKKHKKRIHGVKDKPCDICGAMFAFIGDLNSHRKIHQDVAGRKEVKCPQCDKIMMKQNLPVHVRTVHEQKRLYTCPICNKSFTTKYVLNCHLETHKKPSDRVYKYICDYCGAGFINKTIYSDHLNTHTGQRPYKCPTCGKTFKQTSVFHKHLELHSNVKYFCAPCNEMFPNKRAYSSHKQAVHIQSLTAWQDAMRLATNQGEEHQRMLMEQAAEILAQRSTDAGTSQLIIKQEDMQENSISIVTEDDQVDIGPTQSLVTLEDGTVVLVEGDLSQNAEAEGIVPEIVHSEDMMVTQTDDMEGTVLQISQDVEESNHFQCGYCEHLFSSMEDIQNHIVINHPELVQDKSHMELEVHEATEDHA